MDQEPEAAAGTGGSINKAGVGAADVAFNECAVGVELGNGVARGKDDRAAVLVDLPVDFNEEAEGFLPVAIEEERFEEGDGVAERVFQWHDRI